MKVEKQQMIGFVMALIALLLSGCSSLKSHSWVNPEFQDHLLTGKVIVLATFEDPYLSGEFEVVFAQRLLDFVSATSMHAAVKDVEKYDKDQIESLLRKNKVETLIVTHRVGTANRSQLVPYGASYQTYASNSGSCYTYCSSFQLDESVESFLENSIETSVFDVNSGKLVWSGLREVYDFNSKLSNMTKVVNDVIRDLEAHGMLQATMVY